MFIDWTNNLLTPCRTLIGGLVTNSPEPLPIIKGPFPRAGVIFSFKMMLAS